MLYRYTLDTPTEDLCPITAHVQGAVAETGVKYGICLVYCTHKNAGITINENADPDVRHDFNTFFNKLVPDGAPYFVHTLEGPDDMSAHIKASLIGTSVSIPIRNHRLNLGTWQGIYLCEFRDGGDKRKLSITILE